MTVRWHRLHLSGWSLAWILAVCAAAACGDDSGSVDAGSGAEADAATGADAAAPDAAPPGATVFAVATDFATTGVASTISVPGLRVTQGAVAGVASPDPVVRRVGDRLYIVNRLGQDNVTVLDAADLSLVAQISTGPGSNPQDVAVAGDLLFVAALGSPGVLVLDLTDPDAGVVETIDLADLDPEDGLPDCGTIAALGDRIAVVCGVLDEFVPRGPGAVALIDPDSREVLGSAALDQIRPFGMAQVAGASQPALLVPTVSDFDAPAAGGCVERVIVAEDLPVVDGCLVENGELGGFASAVAWSADEGRVWLSVTTAFDPDDFGPRGQVVSVTEEGGELQVAPLDESVRPMDLALCPTGHAAVSDAFAGVRIFAPGVTDELTTGPLDIGLPPVSNGLACY